MPTEIVTPGITIQEETGIREAFEKGWNVIVWNDHVNLMSYVVFVFQRVLGFDQARARRHMLQVHHQGKSCVATETREKAEFYWQRLQQFGLRTSLEKAA
ncbi:MAG: ATP-dependent Clp protease adapter ClpS [Verrucomicrobia bacterium]|nr:ATP-dependent Clp protease adapter ClpS [Verrucomicrobiota bacterium]